MRDDREPFRRTRNGIIQEIVTARGGMRLSPGDDIKVIAFDTLSSDGETWNQAVAFCLPKPAANVPQTVRRLGPDAEAIRPEDRDAILFDMGVAVGLVRMCIRTRDADLIAALDELEGKSLLSSEGGKAAGLILKTSPLRVMLSPIARVEVYVAIPPPGGESPLGPDTHMLPKLIASGRTHAANAPNSGTDAPSVSLHPRSPWRDAAGKRTPSIRSSTRFLNRLQRHGLAEDRNVRGAIEAAVRDGDDPRFYSWPVSRRGRTQARITLRRLARKMGKREWLRGRRSTMCAARGRRAGRELAQRLAPGFHSTSAVPRPLQ